MKISYNPNDLNSLVIAAIKYSKDRSAELVITDKNTKQTPKEFMEKNYPKEVVSMPVFVLSSPNDDRYESMAAFVRVQMSILSPQSIFIWMRFFANETKFIGERMLIGSHYVEAFKYMAKSIQVVGKPVKIKAVKKAPVKKAVKKTVKKVAKKPNPL